MKMLTDGRTDGRMDDGRTTDAGVTGILIAHLGAFGSGELITKETLISYFAAVVCVYWYSMLYDNIRIKILSMKIFFQILFVWEENDLVFSSDWKK